MRRLSDLAEELLLMAALAAFLLPIAFLRAPDVAVLLMDDPLAVAAGGPSVAELPAPQLRPGS